MQERCQDNATFGFKHTDYLGPRLLLVRAWELAPPPCEDAGGVSWPCLPLTAAGGDAGVDPCRVVEAAHGELSPFRSCAEAASTVLTRAAKTADTAEATRAFAAAGVSALALNL